MSTGRHAKRRVVRATAAALLLLGAVVGARFLGREEFSTANLAADPSDRARTSRARGVGTGTTVEGRAPGIAPAEPEATRVLVAQLLDPPAPPAPSPPVYRDLLIDPGIADDPLFADTPAANAAQGLPGSADIEYRLFDQEARGATRRAFTEQGVGVQLQQHTRSLGRFEARAAVTEVASDHALASESKGGEVVHLAQRDFALTESWMMENEVGHLRARTPSLLAQGYRVRLPEPLIEGAASELHSTNTSFRVTSGALGTFRGRTFPVFSTDYSAGDVSGAAAGARLGPSVEVAAQFWQANDVSTGDGISSFTSTAGAVRYDQADIGKVQANVLHNDDGALGVWLDGATRLAGWHHLAGVYRMEPGLNWIDRNNAVLSDTQGAYWQGGRRSFRTSTTLGVDVLGSNVGGDTSTPTRNSSSAFGSYGYRFRPTTDLNGYLSVGTESIEGGGVEARRDEMVTARGTANTRLRSGQATATVGTSDRSGSNPYRRIDANWDYYWNPVGEFNGLRVGIARVQQSGGFNDFQETSLRAGGGWARGRLNAGATAHLGYLNGAADGQTTSVVLSLGWQVAPAWQMTANLAYNENVLDLTSRDVLRASDRQVFLSVRYRANWGEPERVLGAANGKYGRGTVRGVLYLDRNGNGVRDADEAGAPGVTVLLDGGAAMETNVNGEFVFGPVASGEHRLRVNVANVPLPWGLDEERPLSVTVRPRETAIVDIPLVTERPEYR